jgi:hypothetical protein
VNATKERPVRVPLEKVPVQMWRQAARHLESIRGTPMGEGADAATLGAEACPIYRPDVKGIAYWEFEITGLKRAPVAGKGDPRAGTGTGFIVVSAGRHDVPIPHWSLDRNAPSRALEAKLEKGAQAATVYKIDALCYAAEDAGKKYLSHLGQFPPLVELPAAALKLTPSPGSARYASVKPSRSDDRPPKLVPTIGGRKPPNVKMAAWGSWAKAKQGYAKAFQPQLQALAGRAALRWQVEDQLAKFGEGIHAGQSIVVPLLKPGKAALAGDGVKLVEMTTLRRQPPALQLTALDSATKGEVHFTLELSYADGSTETLPYFVVPSGTPSNNRPPIPPIPLPPFRPPVSPSGLPLKG